MSVYLAPCWPRRWYFIPTKPPCLCTCVNVARVFSWCVWRHVGDMTHLYYLKYLSVYFPKKGSSLTQPQCTWENQKPHTDARLLSNTHHIQISFAAPPYPLQQKKYVLRVFWPGVQTGLRLLSYRIILQSSLTFSLKSQASIWFWC